MVVMVVIVCVVIENCAHGSTLFVGLVRL
jgi:hypothetical protein